MLMVLSPAKKLDYDSPVRTTLKSQPVFMAQAQGLVEVMRRFSAEDLAALMKLSGSLAQLNAERYAAWVATLDTRYARQAVLAFNGDVYDGLAAGSLSDESLSWAQEHLAILSGLYGVLRPLDLIQPHRLEMGTRLETDRGKTLYKWWGDLISEELNKRLDELPGERVLLNLASAEYFKSVNPAALRARVVECVFQDEKQGTWKIISFHAKRARGLMARYIIEHRIDDIKDLQGFDSHGYVWAGDVSAPERLVFRRTAKAYADLGSITREAGFEHNLYAVLAAGFPDQRDAVAIETPDGAYRWSDIESLAARFANLLLSYGLSAGARVAVQVDKSPEALVLYLAVLRAGLVYLPLNTAYQESELDYFLLDAEPEVMICRTSARRWCEPLARSRGAIQVLTLDDDGSGSLMDAAEHQPDQFDTVARQPGDLAAILYTSGTTGRSKGAMLSHGNLASNALVLKAYWGWRTDDVLLHMLPIFHVHGLFVAANGALLAGARMIWLPRLDVDQALHYLPRCTLMMGVPTYYVRLLADTRFGREHCSNMRLFISGSAPLMADTFQKFQDRTGMTILERYGMSETNMLCSNPYDAAQGPRLAGTVGPALPGVSVRVVGDDDLPVAVGQPGHVQVMGPNVFSAYWKMPEKTMQEFTPDGWFRTGDIGVLGGDGIPDSYLSIVGRSKDLIITGGYNVYPKEIELLLDSMDGVLESAVFGVPDDDLGEAVVAVVVPGDGSSPDISAMHAQLKTILAGYKLPRQIHVIQTLPRNAMGKVQKNILRQDYAAIDG